jgi:hypothetical protein
VRIYSDAAVVVVFKVGERVKVKGIACKGKVHFVGKHKGNGKSPSTHKCNFDAVILPKQILSVHEKVKFAQVCVTALPWPTIFYYGRQYTLTGKDRIGVVLDEPLGTNNGTIKGNK